jgi:hypothetical protein
MSEQAKQWAGPATPLGTLTELADHHAIGQLPKIYALGMDMRDLDLARSAFALDAVAEGKQGMESIEQHLKFVYGVASSFHATQHVISNQYIQLNGDAALVWSYGVAQHKVAPGEQRDEIIAGVQYREKCRRFAQGWLIVERSVANQWIDMGPAKRRS